MKHYTISFELVDEDGEETIISIRTMHLTGRKVITLINTALEGINETGQINPPIILDVNADLELIKQESTRRTAKKRRRKVSNKSYPKPEGFIPTELVET